MDSSPLATLPLELIFRILDFLEPHEYSGFSCTCRYAVLVVNQKLDNPEDQEKLWSGFDLNDRKTLHKQLPPWKSRTARYVDKERKEEEKRYLLQLEQHRRRMEDYVCCYVPIDDDPDL
jgi:hypothetical protein